MRSILVVDDSPDMRAMFCCLLRSGGYAVMEAADGVECLHRIIEQEFNLVLLDLCMPRMDGLDVLRRLPTLFPSRKINVLVLTAVEDPQRAHEALQLGAAGYLVKGRLNLDEFTQLVGKHCAESV